MLVLGIETSTQQTSVALGTERGPVATMSLAGELESRAEDILVVGTAALTYRHELQEAGSKVEFASAERSYPAASALVQLAVPRFQREEFDRPSDVQPYYVRKSDAEIAWDQRRRAG